MKRLLVVVALAMGVAAIPARAFADEGSGPGGPVKLTDGDLDAVTAGTGPPAFVLAAGHGPPAIRNPPPANRNQTQPPQVIGTQVNFVIDNVTFTFNVGPDSSVNLATVLQLSLLSQPIQSGAATAVQTGG